MQTPTATSQTEPYNHESATESVATQTSTPRFLDTSAVLSHLKAAGLPSGKTWLFDSIGDGSAPGPIKIGNRNYWAAEVWDSYIAEKHAASLAAAEVGGE